MRQRSAALVIQHENVFGHSMRPATLLLSKVVAGHLVEKIGPTAPDDIALPMLNFALWIAVRLASFSQILLYSCNVLFLPFFPHQTLLERKPWLFLRRCGGDGSGNGSNYCLSFGSSFWQSCRRRYDETDFARRRRSVMTGVPCSTKPSSREGCKFCNAQLS